jgi:hypothetical protein
LREKKSAFSAILFNSRRSGAFSADDHCRSVMEVAAWLVLSRQVLTKP